MNLGDAFKKIRAEKGMSQRDVAAELGVTPAAIWKIENGRVVPRVGTIVKFCEIMEVPVAYFYNMSMTMEDYSTP